MYRCQLCKNVTLPGQKRLVLIRHNKCKKQIACEIPVCKKCKEESVGRRFSYHPNSEYYALAPYMVWTEQGPGFGVEAHTSPFGTPHGEERTRCAANAKLFAAADLLVETVQKVVAAKTSADMDEAILLSKEALREAGY